MRDTINNYLEQFDFDIRKTHDARFVDQKCTPDLICFMADCILNTAASQPIFTANDVWQSQYFKHHCKAIYNKPDADDVRAKNEYNKWFSQSIKLFCTAGLLDADLSTRPAKYSIKNEDMLDYISRKDWNAYNFLYCYFSKVLKDSGFWKHFEAYLNNVGKDHTAAKVEIYNRYYRLISGNTPSKSAIDIHRMFHKVLNVLAVEHRVPGSSGEEPRLFSDLMYNTKNWRDLNKDKSITRQEARENKQDTDQQEAYNNYYIQKAISLIRRIQQESEVHDAWSNAPATQVHHIFPKSQYPEIAHYVENLILLTATQHNTKAHPNNNTKIIDRDYQLVCLLAKSDTIEKSLQQIGEKYYRKGAFLYVINIGLNTNIESQISFSDLKKELIRIYNAS
ncbi:MAG: hypothetical protein NC301_07995 [Bacteroides sp.]|nr:hypothetical protein [Bacteroides sp.]MCM1379438.1 hypothetical protein [Bacteroides sp.]MCM1445299.1 hypothetical protein [Prevotella sp.]